MLTRILIALGLRKRPLLDPQFAELYRGHIPPRPMPAPAPRDWPAPSAYKPVAMNAALKLFCPTLGVRRLTRKRLPTPHSARIVQLRRRLREAREAARRARIKKLVGDVGAFTAAEIRR